MTNKALTHQKHKQRLMVTGIHEDTAEHILHNLAVPVGPKEVTYSDLLDLINSGTLTTGQQYLITDYTTVHYLIDGNGTQDTATVFTGPVEPLIATAVSATKLDSRVVSTLYPQDVIHYDPLWTNWSQDQGFADLADSASPVIITGFKGVITYRWDTVQNNSTTYDFRHVKFRRWRIATPATYSAAATYNFDDKVLYNGFVYSSMQGGNLNHTPDPGSSFWKIQYAFDEGYEYWGVRASEGLAGDYQDFTTFATINGATYEKCFTNNHIGGLKDDASFYNDNASILSNNVFVSDEDDWRVVNNNRIDSGVNNTCYGDFYENTIGQGFNDNRTTSGFSKNLIGGFFRKNVVGRNFTQNTIGGQFTLNNLGSGFSSNTVGGGCAQNRIGHSWNYNHFGSGISGVALMTGGTGNTIGSNNQNFYVKSGFTANAIQPGTLPVGSPITDWTAATHLYATYSCTVFKANDASVKLQYYAGSTPTVVAATA